MTCWLGAMLALTGITVYQAWQADRRVRRALKQLEANAHALATLQGFQTRFHALHTENQNALKGMVNAWGTHERRT
jgi:hypothetical protein